MGSGIYRGSVARRTTRKQSNESEAAAVGQAYRRLASAPLTGGNRHSNNLYRFFAKNGRPRFPQNLCGPSKVSCSVSDAASNAA